MSFSHSKKRKKASKKPKRNDLSIRLFEAFSASFGSIGTAVCSRASQLVKEGRFEEYLALTVDPEDYTNASSFFVDYQAVKFFAKCQDLPIDYDREGPALEKWYSAEARCKATNDSIRRIVMDPFEGSANEILHLARIKINNILGRLSVTEWLNHCGWGPGATSSVSGRDCSSQKKFQAKADVTSDFLPYVKFITNEFPLWNVRDATERNYSKLTFVPKNAKIDRVICAEPHLNTFFQKGLGGVMRNRLKKIGIDLDNGQSIHQYFASRLSIDKTGSTIDLSSASDTVAKALVATLLPTDWLHALSITRTPVVELPDGRKWLLEKFSAMGNGYTFELETLIFYSLTWAIAKYYDLDPFCLVYGDDIIAATALADKVETWFPRFGFEINTDKTFRHNSRFRESCGMDSFEGIPVRPFFLKELPRNEQDLFKLANGIREVAAQHSCAIQYSFPFNIAGYNSLLRNLNPPRVESRVLDLVASSELPILDRTCSVLLKQFYDATVSLIDPMRRNFVSFPCSTDGGLIGSPNEVPVVEHHSVGTPHSRKLSLIKDIYGVHFQDTDSTYLLYETRDSSIDERDLSRVSLRRGVTYRYRRKVRPHKWYIFGDWA